MTKLTMLGGLTYTQFLREYWQKKPLLIRQAFPDFQGILGKNDLLSLSYSDHIPSRLITYQRKKWQLQEGPFNKALFKKLTGAWTLLVQDVNHVVPKAQTILNQFNFIPYARLDDLMISYATPGGGVGPHVDSYDVFLLQGYGRRQWQISNQKDQRLLENMPLKILKHFTPTAEWVLEPGDMLYLPPNYAHYGVAIDDCMTYSIGFRAPSHQELAVQFFGYLQEHIQLDGIYQDPDLIVTKNPAQISNQMIKRVNQIIKTIRFDNADISQFLGMYLTEPKPTVIFNAPKTVMKIGHFLKYIKTNGFVLDPKSQMLYIKNTIFINGERYTSNNKLLHQLANDKHIQSIDSISQELVELFYQWYLDGYILLITNRIDSFSFTNA